MKMLLKHDGNFKSRAQKLTDSVMSNKKVQHKMINSSPDFTNIQDLYLNSFIDWLSHPKCEIVLATKGDAYGQY